jgi:excisionase family DNA binding protein
MMIDRPADLLTVGDAGRLLGLSGSRVRQLVDDGRVPAVKTARGVRLLRLQDVESLAKRRSAERTTGSRETTAPSGP